MVVARHLDDLARRNLRPSTIDQRRRCLARIRRHGVDLLAVTHRDLVDYLDTRPWGPEARATEISHIRGFYRWCVAEELLDVDPSARLVRPNVPRRLPRPMPEADFAVAVAMASERILPWLMLAAYAGLRAQDMSGLRAEHVHVEQGVLLVPDGKGGGEAAVPLAPVLAPVLAGLPRRGWLFPRGDGRPGPTPPHRISQLSNRYLHSIGIRSTLHTLRHRFGTMAYRASGRDLRVTQELMRHRSPVSTALYTWLDPGEKAGIVAALPTPLTIREAG